LKIWIWFTRTLLASETQLFVKIVNLLKRRFIILWKLWTSFQKENPTLRLSWQLKIVFLENLVKDLIHRVRIMEFQSLFQLCQKNNRLKNRNNWLLHASIVWKWVILLGSAKLGNFLFLKVLWSGFLRFPRFLMIKLMPKDPNFFLLLDFIFLQEF